MTNTLERFSFLSAPATDNPYLSFPVAVQTGVLHDPEAIAKPLNAPAGVTLANGFIPNAHEAGLVDVGLEIIAFDLVSLEIYDELIRISSAPKSSVEHNGHISDEGVVVMQNRTGLLRFVAVAVDSYKRPWVVERLRSPRSPYIQSAGRITVLNASVLEMPDFEATEIDLTTNSVLTKPRARYY